MQVRFSNEQWNALDAKLENIKKQQLNFGFLIVLVVISVFLYLGLLYFNQKKMSEFDSLSNDNVNILKKSFHRK